MIPLLPAAKVFQRHLRSGVPPACGGRSTRPRPRPSAPGYAPRGQPPSPERVPGVPFSSEGAAGRFPQPQVRVQFSARAARASDRHWQACALPRPAGRSGEGAGFQGIAHAQRLSGHRAVQARVARRRGIWKARSGHARRERSRPRRRRTSHEPRLLWRRRRVPPAAAASWIARNRRAAPWRCREAQAQAHPRGARRGSKLPAGHPPRAQPLRPLLASPSESRHSCHSHRPDELN